MVVKVLLVVVLQELYDNNFFFSLTSLSFSNEVFSILLTKLWNQSPFTLYIIEAYEDGLTTPYFVNKAYEKDLATIICNQSPFMLYIIEAYEDGLTIPTL